MKKSKTREELLESVVEYYKTNNRAAEHNNGYETCRYINADGCRCAIGKEISEELCNDLEADGAGDVEDVFDKLPGRLRDMGVDFLLAVQELHDRSVNWNSSSKFGEYNLLSESGKDYYNSIIVNFGLDLEYL